MTTEGKREQAARPLAVGADLGTAGNIDQVRDILFGQQLRDIEKRFARIEETAARESAELRRELLGRLEALERLVKKEIEALIEGARGERALREEGDGALGREVQELGRGVDRKTTQLREDLTTAQRELHHSLLEQTKALFEELRRRAAELEALLGREAGELRGSRVDRRALASMFTEMAMRLSNQPPLGEGE